MIGVRIWSVILKICFFTARFLLPPAVGSRNLSPPRAVKCSSVLWCLTCNVTIRLRRFVSLYCFHDAGFAAAGFVAQTFPPTAIWLMASFLFVSTILFWFGLTASLCLVPLFVRFLPYVEMPILLPAAVESWNLVLPNLLFFLIERWKLVMSSARSSNRNCNEICPSLKATSSPRRDSKAETWFPRSSFLYFHKRVQHYTEWLIDWLISCIKSDWDTPISRTVGRGFQIVFSTNIKKEVKLYTGRFLLQCLWLESKQCLESA